MKFSLLGGPLHGLGLRAGLVRGSSNTTPLGLVLGVGAWTVLVALAFIAGGGNELFALSALAVHVRLLVAIPLFFVCESWVNPRMASFVNTITVSGVVPRSSLAALESRVAWTLRRKDAWLPEAICLVLALLLSKFGSSLLPHGTSADFDPSRSTGGVALAGRWYWIVCLPLFRFLVLRWLWRLGLWSLFLWRVARLELHLVPTHPDGAAGLGYLEVVHGHFLPLIFAISALQAAALTEEISAGSIPFESVYPALGVVLLVNAVLFLAPAFLFTPKLWACRVKGLSEYMEFASGYVGGFERKWLGPDAPPDEPVLGTPDLQSLADLGNSMSAVRHVRIVPINVGLLRDVAIFALLPMLPLALLKYPLAELLEKFIARLAGG